MRRPWPLVAPGEDEDGVALLVLAGWRELPHWPDGWEHCEHGAVPQGWRCVMCYGDRAMSEKLLRIGITATRDFA